MIRRRVRLGAAFALAISPLPTAAADMRTAMATLEAQDARFQSIAWRLVRGNAALCAGVRPAAGLLLYDVRNFAGSADVRRALGITGDIAIGAVAQESPAFAAGLRGGEELVVLDGQAMAELPPAAHPSPRIDALHDRIDLALAKQGEITLGLPGRQLTVRGETTCAARFELVTQGDVAQSDGRRVQVSVKALDEIPDDAVLAALLAHELAHQLLGHAASLKALGHRRAEVRRAEREADRLTPWLMANAGYNPAAALGWVDGWVRRRDWGWLGDGTHDGPKARKALIAAELVAIAAHHQAGQTGPLDWRPLFDEAREHAVLRP